MTDEFRIFLATIAGEAINSSPAAWRAVASTIMNRVGVREWKKRTTPLQVIAHTGFDAFNQRNQPYCRAWKYFGAGRPATDGKLDALKKEVINIFLAPKVNAIPGIILYFSPRAQAMLHKLHPDKYRHEVPTWALSPLVEEVKVPGTEKDDFRWFRYREVVA